jgi:hypothetical protein
MGQPFAAASRKNGSFNSVRRARHTVVQKATLPKPVQLESARPTGL